MQQQHPAPPTHGGGLAGELPPHSENADEELQLVTMALEAIYSASNATPTNPSTSSSSNNEQLHQRDKADTFLTTFQRLPIAWVVCDRLLALPPPTSENNPNEVITYTQRRFFAAQTLHTKCRTEIHQLPPDSLSSLRDSLLQHFATCASSSTEKALVTRLGMAVSALAIQMRWMSIIPDIMNSLLAPRPELGEAILELFKLLPEECSSDRLVLLDEGVRHEFYSVLYDAAGTIWNFLSSAVIDKTSSLSTRECVLHCLHSWLRYVSVNPALIENSPLLPWIFSSLENGSECDTFELAVDVVIEIVRMYPSADDGQDNRNMGLIQKVIPLVMALGQPDQQQKESPFQQALKTQDEDGLRGYCRIFTEMGESYMSLIMSPEELNQIALVELVLVCSGIPDNEIANITLHFWYKFVTWLEDLEPYSYRQIKIDYYTPQIIRLLSICTKLLCYPPNISTLSSDRVDDIQRDRYYVSETVEDCCRLLGGDAVLRSIGDTLREECNRVSALPTQEQQLNDWHGIEGCLFAIKSISRYIPNDENVVLPFVMGLIPQLPPAVPLLRCTANLTVGKYASWLGVHSNLLQPLLPYLAQGLSIEQCTSASAIAIKELCEECNEQLMLGDSVLQLYDGIVASQQQQSGTAGATSTPTLALNDELEVLEGACKAVSRQLKNAAAKGTNSDATSAYLNRLVQPIGVRLTALAAPESSCGPKQLIAEMERLTVIIRFLTIPGQGSGGGDNSSTSGPGPSFILDLMRESWPLLDAISQKHPRDIYIAEKLCRLHKHALRGSGIVSYAPMLEPLMTQLTRNFAQSHLSPYLYAASICISEYGTDPTHIPRLFGMVSEMSNTVFSLLRTMDDFTSHPDVVEEFFFLAGRMMCKCPEPLVMSPLLVSLLQCASVGMQLQHRDANRGTLNFLENAFSYGLSVVKAAKGGGGGRSSTGYDDSACKEALERAIVSEGQPIVNNLAKALLGDLPAYRLDSGTGSIAGVLFKLNDLCPELLLQWINPALSTAPETAKEAFMGSLVNRVSRDEFNLSVRRFTSICERSQKLGGGSSAASLGARH